MFNKTKCKATNCNNSIVSKGYCSKHYQQIRKNGKLSERTRYDPNSFKLRDDICEIELRNKNQEIVAIALIDRLDYPKVLDHKWKINPYGYPVTKDRNTRKTIFLHNFLFDYIPNQKVQIDHENSKPLDNRRINLRFCTVSQNNANRKMRKDNVSGFTGVMWRKDYKKWVAYIGVNRKMITLGYFRSKTMAAIAYNKAALKHYGEFAQLNKL